MDWGRRVLDQWIQHRNDPVALKAGISGLTTVDLSSNSTNWFEVPDWFQRVPYPVAAKAHQAFDRKASNDLVMCYFDIKFMEIYVSEN